MPRTKDVSGVEAKPRFQPKEASLKVLVHQAGTIEGYDKVIPHPALASRSRLEPNPPQPRSANPEPAEPSQRRAGERFGPIELPKSVEQKYDTKPLGTLPLADPPLAPEPAVAPHGASRALLLGAALVASMLVGAWGAIVWLRSGPDEADPRPIARAPVVTEKPAGPPAAAPRPPVVVVPKSPMGQEKRVPASVQPQGRAPRTLPAKEPVKVELPPAPSPSSQAPASKEANDLMLGEW